MMAQYRRIKDEVADSILFFRLGDFYEMFEADAREASSLLDLTLTQRAGVPMCGIPYHAAASYISRLLAAGKKVAICEQTTAPGKGLMSREVVEVITPGTVLDDSYLSRTANNYLLAARAAWASSIGLAYADVSTGELSRDLVSVRRPRGDAEAGAAPAGPTGGAHAGVASRGRPGDPRAAGGARGAPGEPLPRLELRRRILQGPARAAARRGEPQGLRAHRRIPRGRGRRRPPGIPRRDRPAFPSAHHQPPGVRGSQLRRAGRGDAAQPRASDEPPGREREVHAAGGPGPYADLSRRAQASPVDPHAAEGRGSHRAAAGRGCSPARRTGPARPAAGGHGGRPRPGAADRPGCHGARARQGSPCRSSPRSRRSMPLRSFSKRTRAGTSARGFPASRTPFRRPRKR